ncbi:unnamed protein product [Blepharisma stoltei]|uniref:Uncharacterized protein n=1 Tax=Blepharisma stoltei TaxID=1481888 RepID=A0AAU9IPF6_9CILI|nr:unnamed protein product [Blepharisma stoltei]
MIRSQTISLGIFIRSYPGFTKNSSLFQKIKSKITILLYSLFCQKTIGRMNEKIGWAFAKDLMREKNNKYYPYGKSDKPQIISISFQNLVIFRLLLHFTIENRAFPYFRYIYYL